MENKKLLRSAKSNEKTMDSLMAEMVLDTALLNFRKVKIQQKIDQALAEKNKREFMRLTEELKSIS